MKKIIFLTMLLLIGFVTLGSLGAFDNISCLQDVYAFLVIGSPGAGLAFAYAFADLEEPEEGFENMGGFTINAYLAITSHVETFPSLIANPSSAEEAIVMAGDYVMKSNKYFLKLYATEDTLKMAAEQQGDLDGQSFAIKGELFHPGTKNEALGLARMLNNARTVLILIDDNGERFVIGSKEHPCYLKPKVDWGQKAADRKGVTFEFMANSYSPAMKYEGAIPLSGGVQVDPIS